MGRRGGRFAAFAVLAGVLLAGAGLPARAQDGPAPTPTAAAEAEATRQEPPPGGPEALTAPYEPEQTVQGALAASRLAGEIDYPTSLRYRAYALTGDARLPAALRAYPADGHDRALFEEIARNADRLPAEARAELAPLLLRPADPGSAFHRPVNGGAALARDDDGDGLPCEDDWASLPSEANPGAFRVWARCTEGYEETIRDGVAMTDEFWGEMVEAMGDPVPDLGTADAGGDEAIDIYLVEGRETVDRARQEYDLDEGRVLAVAIQTPPFRDRTASGYIVANRAPDEPEELQSTLAHEFFHVLQFAHNATIGFRETGEEDEDGYPIYEADWFLEATAMWAETHFMRETADEFIYTPWFTTGFQGTEASLHANYPQGTPNSFRMYAGFIWFSFMEQELGAEAVTEAWDRARELEPGDFEGVVAILDDLLPFEEHFREFAVRNLNQDLAPGDPVSPSYRDLDPDFPEGAKPLLGTGPGDWALPALAEGDDPLTLRTRVAALSARYYYWFVPSPQVREVTLDLSDLAGEATLDADLIVRIGGEWERVRLDPDEPATFCRAEAGQEIEAFYLVLSNHDTELGEEAGGLIRVRPSGERC